MKKHKAFQRMNMYIDVKSRRDITEYLYFKFQNPIQSECHIN